MSQICSRREYKKKKIHEKTREVAELAKGVIDMLTKIYYGGDSQLICPVENNGPVVDRQVSNR